MKLTRFEQFTALAFLLLAMFGAAILGAIIARLAYEVVVGLVAVLA